MTADSRTTPPWLAPVAMGILAIALAISVTRDGAATTGMPVVWFLLTAYVGLRHRHEGWVPTIFVPAAVLFLMWFARAAFGIFLPFLLALLAAYLLDPLIDRLESRLGRTRAIVLLGLPALLLVILLGLVVIPSLLREIGQLLQRLPELQPFLEKAYASVMDVAREWGIRVQRRDLIEHFIGELESLGPAVAGAGLGVLRGVQGLVDFISFLVITPVMSFYLLRDFDRLRESGLEQFEGEQRDGVEDFLVRLDRSLSGYIRGQLLVGVIVGVLFYAGMSILGMDYALVVGLAAVVLNLVPFIGSVLTAVLALSVGLLSDPSWGAVVKVGLLYGGIQILDAALISPRVMGDSLELHPVVVMLALLLAGRFFGLAGVLIAVPAVAVLRETFRRWSPELVRLLAAPDHPGDPG